MMQKTLKISAAYDYGVLLLEAANCLNLGRMFTVGRPLCIDFSRYGLRGLLDSAVLPHISTYILLPKFSPFYTIFIWRELLSSAFAFGTGGKGIVDRTPRALKLSETDPRTFTGSQNIPLNDYTEFKWYLLFLMVSRVGTPLV
jgi:hypothetical protein